jgi:hypothetical protein
MTGWRWWVVVVAGSVLVGGLLGVVDRVAMGGSWGDSFARGLSLSPILVITPALARCSRRHRGSDRTAVERPPARTNG